MPVERDSQQVSTRRQAGDFSNEAVVAPAMLERPAGARWLAVLRLELRCLRSGWHGWIPAVLLSWGALCGSQEPEFLEIQGWTFGGTSLGAAWLLAASAVLGVRPGDALPAFDRVAGRLRGRPWAALVGVWLAWALFLTYCAVTLGLGYAAAKTSITSAPSSLSLAIFLFAAAGFAAALASCTLCISLLGLRSKPAGIVAAVAVLGVSSRLGWPLPMASWWELCRAAEPGLGGLGELWIVMTCATGAALLLSSRLLPDSMVSLELNSC